MNETDKNAVEILLKSKEPVVRFLTKTQLLGENAHSAENRALQRQITTSPLVKKLLSERTKDGTIPFNVYGKWYGAHWVLVALADLGYPSGDKSLIPLREQVFDCWLDDSYFNDVPLVKGRYRRCASQQGAALYSLCRLGLDDKRCEQLVELLLKWQWPDGGWNCDKKPEAHVSSFTETLLPLRGLIWYRKTHGKIDVDDTIKRAAEVILSRRLFKRIHDGKKLDRSFTILHYPCYWHYDILIALQVLHEGGLIGDFRCQEALDLLESKRLPDGMFPAEEKYYHAQEKFYPNGGRHTGYLLVDWQPQSKRKGNPFVTIDALTVLKEAGR